MHGRVCVTASVRCACVCFDVGSMEGAAFHIFHHCGPSLSLIAAENYFCSFVSMGKHSCILEWKTQRQLGYFYQIFWKHRVGQCNNLRLIFLALEITFH